MSRRSHSASPGPTDRPQKRARLASEHLTPDSFKDGVFLAPMVRSGALPTRLMSLKHGASLVWGPEIVDKAILHATRIVDPSTGIVSYNGTSGRAMWTTHPIEKPYLIYQIGSADPDLAVQAAKMVQNDVSGIDLNCGCPKPFSTHSGMGAALLSTPDLLCSILVALRAAMPPEITVTAKIRLLPTQEETLELVERIVNTGVSAITIHCRTRNMRPREKALVDRLKEIVQFVEGMGKGIAVIENGDCVSWEDAKRIRELTGAHSVMIATAAEANPTVFSPNPLTDLEKTFIPSYIRLCKFLGNFWGLTKVCATQFKGHYVELRKADAAKIKTVLAAAKNYDMMANAIHLDKRTVLSAAEVEQNAETNGEETELWTGEQDFKAIVEAIEARGGQIPRQGLISMSTNTVVPVIELEGVAKAVEPRPNLGPPTSGVPPHLTGAIPVLISGHDAGTPTPVPAVVGISV